MSASLETGSPIATTEKRSKKKKHEKKRPREDDENATTPRNHKRSKSEAPLLSPEDSQEPNDDEVKKKKKSKKSKQSEPEADTEEAALVKKEKKSSKKVKPEVEDANIEDEVIPESPVKSKKSKKDRRKNEAVDQEPDQDAAADAPEHKNKKRSRQKLSGELPPDESTPKKPEAESSDSDSDKMDVDNPEASTNGILQPAHAPANPEFPFATQTVSLYVPLYPIGFDQPLTKVAEQHLKPLLNHYSPLLKGVLLDYRHVTLGEHPTRADPRNPPTDRTPTLLSCKDEYAVGFGWLTAEVYLFVPRRGAWMEGVVNLQSEGHLGIVCWGKFNASIEANRVPRGWRFIDIVQRAEDAKKALFRNGRKKSLEDGGAEDAADNDQENLEDSLQQMHATGYWVDAAGRRVKGKMRFRIKNFEVGTAGDHGYISIEGTMLEEEAERALQSKELERERARRAKSNPSGMLRRLTRSVPEFSMTSFGREDEEEDSTKKVELYVGSRPGTP